MSQAEPIAPIANGVWYFSGDLLFASRVKLAAQNEGCPFVLLGKWPDPAPFAPSWVVVDLATKFGAMADLYQLARQHFPDSQCIAFGPHVQAGRLSEARQLGFDHVYTKGQFDTVLPSLFHPT